jgi:hypothetical protein
VSQRLSVKGDVEYTELKGFLGWLCDHTDIRGPGADPAAHPIRILTTHEGRVKPSILKAGLKQAVNDALTKIAAWPEAKKREVSKGLDLANLPSIEEMAIRFSGRLERVEKRGSINNEDEFYLVRNACEMPLISADGPRLEKLQRLLGEFEFGSETNNPSPTK